MPKFFFAILIVLPAIVSMPGGAHAQPAYDAQARAAAVQSGGLPGYSSGNPAAREVVPAATSMYKGYVADDFLVTTTSVVEGYKVVEYRGLVEGSSVRVPSWTEDSAAGAQEIYGGSINVYAQLCEEARMQAFATMVTRAKALGANAIIGIHFDSQVMPLDKGRFATGVVCVGTAIVVRRADALR